MTADTWTAVAIDNSGFVIDDELLRAWADAVSAGKTGWHVPCEPPDRIVIVKGSALPVPQSDNLDEEFFRMPSGYYSDDLCSIVENLDEIDEPARVVLYWERALAAAAGMNAAGAR